MLQTGLVSGLEPAAKPGRFDYRHRLAKRFRSNSTNSNEQKDYHKGDSLTRALRRIIENVDPVYGIFEGANPGLFGHPHPEHPKYAPAAQK